MSPELVQGIAGTIILLLLGVIGFFISRTMGKIDRADERQEKALAALGEKIDRLTDRVSDQVKAVEREVGALRVEFADKTATLRAELGGMKARQDSLEKDLNNAMRWVRTEFEGIHQELAADTRDGA